MRRGRYQYNHTNQCQQIVEHPLPSIQATTHQTSITPLDCSQSIVNENHHSVEQICTTPNHSNHRIKHRLNAFKIKDTNDAATLSDSDTQRDSIQSNTLPFRKARKKIVENGAKSIGPHQSNGTARVNVQTVFSSTQNMSTGINRTHDNIGASCSTNFVHIKMKNNHSNGLDNSGFQSMDDDLQIVDAMPVEMYVNEIGNRDVFMRNRLQFVNRDYEKLNAFNSNVQLPSTSLRTHSSSHSLPKDLTRYSICSAESGEKTDYTDLSPMTPSTPHSNKDSNAINLAFQRELKSQHQQQVHQIQHSKMYKDISEASGSSSTQPYSSRYYDSTEHKRDTISTNLTPKSLQEIHLRPIAQHPNLAQNNHMSTHDNNATYNNLNTVNAPIHYPKFERNSVYQRPTYSFATAQSTSGHSSNGANSNKYSVTTSITPRKRRIHATQSLAITNSNVVSSLGDLSTDLQRLANIRKESAKDETSHNSQDERQSSPYEIHNSHSKTLNENDWSDHSSGDRRL